MKDNVKFAIEAAWNRTSGSIIEDGLSVPVNAARGQVMATTEVAHRLDLWERRICPYCGTHVREGAGGKRRCARRRILQHPLP